MERNFKKLNIVLLHTIMVVVILLLLEIAVTKTYAYIKANKAAIRLISSGKSHDELRVRFVDYCDSKEQCLEREQLCFEEDILHLTFDNYDSIHLSMWNTSKLDDGTYETFWAKTIYYPQHNYQNLQELSEYLMAFSNNEVKAEKIYLSIDPYELYKAYYNYTFYDKEVVPYEEYISDNIFSVIEDNPNSQFVIILPSLSIDYFCSVEDEIDDIFLSWYTFTMMLHWWDNVSVQYMGTEEWLIANSSNFSSKYEIIEEVGRLAITYIYKEDLYEVKPPEILEFKEQIKEMCLSQNEYRDCGLKDKKIVFYGDSLFALYEQDTLTIPGMIESMTGAKCYNLAIGGTTASQIEENSFSEVASTGVGRDAEAFMAECAPTDDIIFVILYGVNDYLLEASIAEVAVGLFTGAESLISEYPSSKLLFIAPYMVKETDNEISYESYIDAIRDVSRGYHSSFLNLYEDSGISRENESEYLLDGIHPNEATNVLLAKLIVEKLCCEVN